MGKVIYLPGCDPSPNQAELVEKATTLLMKEVIGVFIEQRIEPGSFVMWYQAIQRYLWAAPIEPDEQGELDGCDVREWRHYWRNKALDRISTLKRRY